MSESIHHPVSVVIPTHNEGQSLYLTVEAVLHTSPSSTEILIINDHSSDDSLDFLEEENWPQVRRIDLKDGGISNARNLGAREARHDTLVFLDAHCIPRKGWLQPLLAALEADSNGIVAPAVSVLGNTQSKGYGADLAAPDLGFDWRGDAASEDVHEIPLACGCAMAMRRDYLLEVGAFDAIRTYGMEDTELSIRTWLLGGTVRVVPASEVAHRFKESAQYAVNWTDFLYNRLRVAVLHFDDPILARLHAHFRGYPSYGEAMALLEDSDVWVRRDTLRAQRVHDGTWFCERFDVAL